MSRMFKSITRTWNPFTGCRFNCTYCWARKLIEGRLHHLDRYKAGFIPTTHPARFNPRFKPGDFVFVCDMGDMAWCLYQDRQAIMSVIESFPETRFLIQTKAPMLFNGGSYFPGNTVHGCTLETNRSTTLFSKAPIPLDRYHAMVIDKHLHKFLSIEPVMDFDLDIFASWILDIRPEIVEVGADNYHNDLPEPPWGKVQQLLEALRGFVPQVIEKDGLARLREEDKANGSRTDVPCSRR